jgi:hypothetical protein
MGEGLRPGHFAGLPRDARCGAFDKGMPACIMFFAGKTFSRKKLRAPESGVVHPEFGAEGGNPRAISIGLPNGLYFVFGTGKGREISAMARAASGWNQRVIACK